MSLLMVSVFFYSNILLINSIQTSKYIHCYNQESDHSQAAVSCGANYSLLSCNAVFDFSRDSNKNSSKLLGVSLIEKNNEITCENAANYSSVRTIARCCNLTDDNSSFHLLSSDKSDTKSSSVSATCPSSSELVGCTAKYAGYFHQNKQCMAGNDMISYAICYETVHNDYELECVSVVGEWSDVSTISCPDDEANYFMSSCTAYSPLTHIQSSSIENNVCIARQSTAKDVVASAICCRLSEISDEIETTPIATDASVKYMTDAAIMRTFFMIAATFIVSCGCIVILCCGCYKMLHKKERKSSLYRVGVGSIGGSTMSNSQYSASISPVNSYGNFRKTPSFPAVTEEKGIELEMSVNKTRAMSFEQAQDEHCEDSLRQSEYARNSMPDEDKIVGGSVPKENVIGGDVGLISGAHDKGGGATHDEWIMDKMNHNENDSATQQQ